MKIQAKKEMPAPAEMKIAKARQRHVARKGALDDIAVCVARCAEDAGGGDGDGADAGIAGEAAIFASLAPISSTAGSASAPN